MKKVPNAKMQRWYLVSFPMMWPSSGWRDCPLADEFLNFWMIYVVSASRGIINRWNDRTVHVPTRQRNWDHKMDTSAQDVPLTTHLHEQGVSSKWGWHSSRGLFSVSGNHHKGPDHCSPRNWLYLLNRFNRSHFSPHIAPNWVQGTRFFH